MNEDLSHIIEKALEYATPLPVPEHQLLTNKLDDIHELQAIDHQSYNLNNGCDGVTVELVGNQLGYGNDPIPLITVVAGGENSAQTHICTQNDSLKDSLFQCIETSQCNLDFNNSSTDLVSDSDFARAQSDDFLPHFGHFRHDVPSNETQSSISTASIVHNISEVSETSLSFENDSSRSCTPYEHSIDAASSNPTGNESGKVKRKRRREKNPDPAPAPILPPCSICDDKSSGYHYGANTCEACKGFFRRTLKKKEVKFGCKCLPEEKDIWKRGPYKNGCPACRYDRCLAVGMSKNAIKIGRYTLNHKTSNIKQVKSIEAFDSLIEVAVSRAVAENSPSSSSGIDFNLSSPENIPSVSSAGVTDSGISVSEEPSTSSQSVEDDWTGFADSPSQGKKPKMLTELHTLKEFDTVVKILTEAHMATSPEEILRQPIEALKQKQAEYLEKYTLKKELFGNMTNLSREEFIEFYKVTGIDIDGRIEHIDSAFKFFEEKIAMVVAFAKAIPGLKKLSLDDQANLIKASRAENTLFMAYRLMMRNVDQERKVLTTPWGREMHMEELGKFLPWHLIQKRYNCAKRIAQLNLSVQEISVLRAIAVTSPDRCELKEPEKVARMQEKLVSCLEHLLKVRPGGTGNLLYKITDLLTDLRVVTEIEMEATKKLLVDWPMISINNYNLLKEFLT